MTNKAFNLHYGSRGLESMMAKDLVSGTTESSHLDPQAGGRELTQKSLLKNFKLLPPVKSHLLILPKQPPTGDQIFETYGVHYI